ncbi:MAG: hypothetical protein K2Q32_03400 [Alphaproteobacteria bacterium]|nr:hypothetical protein [Alphaproteobacteria bacterium]
MTTPLPMPSIQETIEFIKIAHADQKDDAGEPYFNHPMRVMNRLPADADLEVKLAALLHDILEDTHYTRADLSAMGYTKRTLDAVQWVTKVPDDKPKSTDPEIYYREYHASIQRIINSGNRDAIMIKEADMSENADETRLEKVEPVRRAHFERKYTKPLQALRAALA